MSEELLNRLTDELKEVKEKNIDLMNRNEDLRELMKSTVNHSDNMVNSVNDMLEMFQSGDEIPSEIFLKIMQRKTQVYYDTLKIKKELEEWPITNK